MPLAFVNKWVAKALAIIVACDDPAKSGEGNGMQYFPVDVAIAMEHSVLAATNLGLETCWIGIYDEKMIKQMLEIPIARGILSCGFYGVAGRDGGQVGRLRWTSDQD